MPRASDPAIICAEYIALSSLFHSIPVAPSLNAESPVSTREHTLSLQQEHDLAKTLAFLAHIQGDAEYVPAVCLQEDKGKGSLNVLFAVNKAKLSDGDDVLHSVQKGFDEIFELLSRVPADGSSSVRNQILNAVVSMCSSRILSRLRLGPSSRWKKPKRCFKDTIEVLILALKHMDQDKKRERNLLGDVDTLGACARQARKSVDAWTQHQVTKRLVQLVESIYHLQQIPQLQAIIEVIPNIYMEPTSRESFLNIVGKVSQYRKAARFLYRTAKETPMARTMHAIPVRLPEKAFASSSMNTYTPDLSAKITEATSKKQQQKLLKEICKVLGLSQEEAQSQYNRQVNNTLKQSKIHAEVQLIAHLQLQHSLSTITSTRVICSSKDACFLCNLFIKAYGKIYTPRSHGVLYPAWRLPRLPQLQEIERRFCGLLKGNFEESLRTLLSTKRKTLHPNPLESTLFSLPVSGTTLSAVGSWAERKSASTEVVQGKETEDLNLEASSILCVPSNASKTPTDGKVESMESFKEPERPDSHSLLDLSNHSIQFPHIPRVSPEIGTRSAPIILQGCKIYGKVGPGETSLLHSAGPLEIMVEGCEGSSTHSYRIEWLNNEEALKMRDEGLPVNAEDINEEVTFFDGNTLHLAARGTVLRLSWIGTDV
ncbi:hypothetical protein BDV06DRAFT_235741 [Aspergillus oleicola]